MPAAFCLRRFHKHLAISLCALAGAAERVQAASIVDEPFNYPANEVLTGKGPWTQFNPGTDNITVSSGSLPTGALGYRSSGGNSVTFGNDGTESAIVFAERNPAGLFYSCLLRINDLGLLSSTGGWITGFGSSTSSFSATVWARATGTPGQFNLGFSRDRFNGNFLSTTFSTGDVILLVVQYAYDQLNVEDRANLWVNPSSSSYGGTAPSVWLSASNGAVGDRAGLDRFVLRQSNSTETPASLTIDDVRIGTTYGSVTSIPEPSAALLLSAGAGLLAGSRRRRRRK